MGIISNRVRSTRRVQWTIAAFALAAASILVPGSAMAASDLADMSLEDLMNAEVTSVSKKAQSKTDAAASITVITSEDLRRGGFTSVPEALRVVPGLQVAQIDANRWAISARGFNQEFASKLLVLIDGRSVYTPLFSGVYWDIQDYPIEDIERIEVIRGPGGTIWGVNAVNGVINVITKHSTDTEGVLLSGRGGSQEHGATGRFGMKLGENAGFRVYGRGSLVEDYDVDQRHDAQDEWNQIRAGFRADATPSENDAVTVSADYYNLSEDRGIFTGTSFERRNGEAEGGNVVVHWKRALDGSGTIGLKAYYDRTVRDLNIQEDRHTGDVEFQHDFSVNQGGSVEGHMVWGLNYRYSTAHLKGVPTQNFDPNDEDFHLGNGFIQGQLDLCDKKWALIAGVKLGGNNWSGFDYQPSGRILFKPVAGHTIWTAVSRAVRNPSQLDRDLFAILPTGAPPPFPPTVTLVGNNDQRSEELLSIEGGYRFFQFERVTAEFSVFHHMYENVTTLAMTSPGVFSFGNEGEVETTGAEIELNIMPTKWWRLSIGYSVLEIEADTPPSPLGGTSVTASNPQHQVVVRTFFDLPAGFEFDASVYWVDGLRDTIQARIPPITQNIEQYVRLDLRIGYKPAEWIELALVGQNLIEARHAEFTDVQSNLASEVPRAGYGQVTLRF